ncbi:MAG: HD-GYP domain-containing protein [Chloroflexi bacterium]|nr:HD-GYP domain-containing protein [Chloroflexota bacterium]
MIEATQYLIGVLGAIAAAPQVWSFVFLALLIVFAYFTFKVAQEVRNGTRRMLESMAGAIDSRDPYTGRHSYRLVELTKITMRELGIVGSEVDLICAAARLHDIGKISIPDGVLQKPAPLEPFEWNVMQSHPARGADLLARYPDFARGADLIRCHHERWDGTGYPHRLKELAIPLGARVIAVADAFDAMTSDRPYRRAMSAERAAWELRAGRGKQWDPAIVDAFLRVIAKQLDRPEIAEERSVGALVPATD